MSRECPDCMPKYRADLAQPEAWREEHGVRMEGWLHPSRDYPALLHCNCCGQYYRLSNGILALIPHRQLSDWIEVKS